MASIPDEAVEAAAEVVWDRADIQSFEYVVEMTRAALEAAAPHLMAAALIEAAQSFSESSPEGDYSSTPAQVIDWMREYADLYRSAGMSERFTIKREVEVEAGREYVWWTVRDRETGYNKTFRSEADANAHAAELTKRPHGAG